MPSLSEVMKFRAEMHEKSMGLIKQKGADYNRDQQEQGDTLFNLRVCEILGIVPVTESGILVRLSDKLMRLISLTKPGREAAVKDESVLDTIADVHNYIDYLGLIWLQRRQANSKASNAGPQPTLSESQKQNAAITGSYVERFSNTTQGERSDVRSADLRTSERYR